MHVNRVGASGGGAIERVLVRARQVEEGGREDDYIGKIYILPMSQASAPKGEKEVARDRYCPLLPE